MSGLFLTKPELIELTGKKHRKLQIMTLAKMRLSSGEKVRYTVRPDDSYPLVPRSQFEFAPKRREPNFAALEQ